LARPIDPDIVRFIIENVEARPDDIGPFTARRFGVTRATASNYLRRLVGDGRLTAKGRTRARSYALKAALLASGIGRLSPFAEDDELWRRELRPKLEGLPKAALDACHFGFTAAVANAIVHSGGDILTWRLRLDARSVELTVTDDGVGAFARLKAALGLEDDGRALLELAKGGATIDPSRHAGRSLFLVSRMFEGFRLASGRLAYVCERDGDGRTRCRAERLSAPLKGTLVTLQLDHVSAPAPGEVFARYAGEGGRPRSEIAVALAASGGEPLASRSQARRLLAGLERCCEANLDFTGAPETGPAFLHEIFGVFARAHPDVRLNALNADPVTAEMISQAAA
jgi:hypothetical protein